MSTTEVATGTGGSGFTAGSLLIAKRCLLVYLRTPQLIVLNTLQMVLVMVGFRYVFGGAIDVGGPISYVDFAVPGFIAAGTLYATIGSAAAIAEDLQGGLIDRLRSLPMSPAAILAGRVLADAVILAGSVTVTTLLGFAIGFRPHGPVPASLGAFLLCVLVGLTFSCVFVALGLLVRTPPGAQGLMPVIFLLTFVSDAYVPVETMPAWLRGFAENQPVTLMVDAVRGLALADVADQVAPGGLMWTVLDALAWAVALMVCFGGAAALVFRRR
jgi:ABC-2 type transport system permease protein